MQYTILGPQQDIVYVQDDTFIISDTASALDFLASARYETKCDKFIINKSCLCETFFVLSTGLAGEILQKFINYHAKLAIVGDYSKYTSKPLKDFIYESNNGQDIFFVSTLETAVQKLS